MIVSLRLDFESLDPQNQMSQRGMTIDNTAFAAGDSGMLLAEKTSLIVDLVRVSNYSPLLHCEIAMRRNLTQCLQCNGVVY